MGKYTERTVARIISLIENDSYSTVEICDAVKISRKTFYEWRDTKPEFRQAIEQAEETRENRMVMHARRSLKRKLEGYTLRETKSTYITDTKDSTKLILKTEEVKTKEYAPDSAAIRLVLERNDRKQREKNEAIKVEKPEPLVEKKDEAYWDRKEIEMISNHGPRDENQLRIIRHYISIMKAGGHKNYYPEKEAG